MTATLRTWLPDPKSPELEGALARLVRTEDVVHVAVMPDAHVAEEVCVGTVTATRSRLFPAAVGGDIGCGMLSVKLDIPADTLAERTVAARVLGGFARAIPPLLHRAREAPALPAHLADCPLSSPVLERLKGREGRLGFGTLGRGNHFIELEADAEGGLWLLVHSGSRAIGPRIRAHHEARAARDPTGLAWLEAESAEGQAYLQDVGWASRYAAANRDALLAGALQVLGEVLSGQGDMSTLLGCDHNHLRRECHFGEDLWVHRKGAMALGEGVLGILPGSMGTATVHVEGRGNADALGSSAHGAGRAMRRGEARKLVPLRRFLREVSGVWFDHRLSEALREEAPSAYKDLGQVLRAGRELVRVVRWLRPVLVYKAT